VGDTSIFLPMTFLPGIGLLILSTSSRYIALINSEHLPGKLDPDQALVCRQLQRSCGQMLHLALTLLYLSATLFSIAPLINLAAKDGGGGLLFVLVLSSGVLCAVAALIVLFLESAATLKSMALRTSSDHERNPS